MNGSGKNLDGSDGAGDLAGNKGLSAAGGLVVEEDAVDGKHVVGLAVVDDAPVGLRTT